MKRKKWLLPVLMALMVMGTSTANAQFRFGVKGGLNITSVKFSEELIKADNVNGLHFGPIIEFMPKSGMGFDLAILYSRKGFVSKDYGFIFRDSDDSFISDYLEVPVNLKCKIGLPVVSPFFAAGPYISLRISGDKVKEIVMDDIVGQIKAKSFGAGLNFTAGAEILKTLQVGLTYNLALTDNYQELHYTKFSGKTHTWMISAAVLF